MIRQSLIIKKPVIRIKNDPDRYGVVLFPIFNVMSFISAFFLNIRAGAIAGIVILIYVITHRECLRCFRDTGFVVFYLANILSVYAYLFNERPIIIFATCITYNLFPMLMYGIGKASTSGERDNPVLRSLIISNIIIVLVGFLIYFIPGLAVRVGMDSMTTAGINEAGIGYRFGSYMGSLELGSICAISVPLLLMYDFKRKLLKPLFLTVFAVAVFLTMQRGAWIVGIAGVLACMIIRAVFYRDGFKSVFVYAVLGVAVVLVLIYFVDHFMSAGFLKHLEIRLQRFNVDYMSAGRSRQTSKAIELFFEHPFGFGLGAAGNKASPYDLQVVPDGNLIRILVETGIFGILSFAIMNIKAICKGIKHKYYYMTVIVLLFLAHSIGSNVLDFYYGSFIYWYILGYLNRSNEYFADGYEINNIRSHLSESIGD